MTDAKQIDKVAADIMRENATKVFATKCATCGKSLAQSLRWLQTRRFICSSCGGQLDDSPLHQLTLAVRRKLRGREKPPKKKAARTVKLVSDKSLAVAGGYQLVLQFRGDSLQDLDALVALEKELIERLADSADVDGHDAGSGEANIFILTSDPVAAFRLAKPVLQRRQSLSAVKAAYRPVDGECYTVIWPVGSREEFVVT